MLEEKAEGTVLGAKSESVWEISKRESGRQKPEQEYAR